MQHRTQDFQDNKQNRCRLLIQCPDQPGIVSSVSKFLYAYDANIMESSQYSTDPQGGQFFMRIVFECPDLQTKAAEIESQFEMVAEEFSMDWRFSYPQERKKIAIFVSKQPHCLLELLWEWQSGDLMADIALVVSNHENAREIVENLHIPFYHVPANKDIREQAEQRQLELLKEYDVDAVVLARYMQILTPNFLEAYPNKIINIHHSFLPAFVGAKPYERAYERGVKLIGATSHYVTSDLDEGPIIEQDTKRVNHRDHVEDLKKIGGSIERSVLARAVKWHIEDRVIVYNNKTIVF